MKTILIRTGLFLGIALMSVTILLAGAFQWKKHIREKNVINSLSFADEYLAGGEPGRVLRLVDEYRATRGEFPEYEDKWVEVELQAAAQMPDNQRLEMIYHEYPVIFADNPDSGLVLARYFLMRGRYSQYDLLRKQCIGAQVSHNDTWLILDADKELQMGNKAKALEILQNMPRRSSGEAARLVRIALILSESQPEKSFQYMREAIEHEPENPEISLAMANFLERQGLMAEARNLYVAATLKAENNPFFADQLAEYYIRTGKYSHAISTWQSIPDDLLGPMQLMKMMAWSKLTIPGQVFDSEKYAISILRYSDEWTPAFSLLGGQKDINLDELSDTNAIYGHPLFLWSQMIDDLKSGNYQAAYTKLLDKYGAFSSVHPEMALALLTVLEMRSGQISPSVMTYVRMYKDKPNIHMNVAIRHLIQDCELLCSNDVSHGSTDKSIQQFWSSENIFALLFSSVGWSGAADQWYKEKSVRDEIGQLPSWAAYAHIKSLLSARNYGSDYNLIELFPPSINDTSLKLLRAEIYLANQDYVPALKGLAEISQLPNDFGVRAGWLTGLLYLERGRLEDVEKLIHSSLHFRESTRGREIEAKLMLARSDTSTAMAIYNSIRDKSPEAQAFLLNHYQKTGDSDQAQKILEEIQSSNINEPALWNLVSR